MTNHDESVKINQDPDWSIEELGAQNQARVMSC